MGLAEGRAGAELAQGLPVTASAKPGASRVRIRVAGANQAMPIVSRASSSTTAGPESLRCMKKVPPHHRASSSAEKPKLE